MLQCGAVTALDVPDEPRAVVVGEIGREAVMAIAAEESATAYHRLDHPQASFLVSYLLISVPLGSR